MEKKRAPFSVDRNGYHIHWHALPAWVCTQCGEAYFEKKEVDKIQRVLRAIDLEMGFSARVA
ncbi:YgiT-type zinc finger protein [Rhodocaloribacter litoris]|nr:YgiT-type zinc finger protein [Rhodocaloribacter litoris]